MDGLVSAPSPAGLGWALDSTHRQFHLKNTTLPQELPNCVCVCVLKVPHSTALSGGSFLLIERRENVMNRTDLSICPDVPPQSSVWSSAAPGY